MSDSPNNKPDDDVAHDDTVAAAPGDETADETDVEALTGGEGDEGRQALDDELAKTVELKRNRRRRTRRRRKTGVALGSLLIITALCCGKILVRTELRDPARLARLEAERRAKLAPGEAEFSDLEYEMMGFIGASLPLIPPENSMAAERYRDFEQAAKIVTRRPDNHVMTAAEMKAEAARIARIIPRRPFIVYVAIAACLHFIMGFVCAMHLGYRPRLFGIRWNLRELDPFVKTDLFMRGAAPTEADAVEEAASS